MDDVSLLQIIKNALRIDWDDTKTDEDISRMIRAGKSYLNGKAGEELDFTSDDQALDLLVNYVRYDRDYALDVFETNYRHLILDLQHSRQMARRQEEQQ